MASWISLLTLLGTLVLKALELWREKGDREVAEQALRDAVAIVEAAKQERTRETLDRLRRAGDRIERMLRAEYVEDETDPYLRD